MLYLRAKLQVKRLYPPKSVMTIYYNLFSFYDHLMFSKIIENLGDVRAERTWGVRAEMALSLFFVGLQT